LAEPLGPIQAVIPVTNPTSTTMFKILIALKTRNPIIIRPHRKAAQCSMEAARLCYEAALSEDAPEDCIQWVHDTSREETRAIMAHQDLALVLATGGGALVKAAYSSGKPALGVGAGNVPVYIERTAVVPFAVEQIIQSKTFDYGTVCASEQALVVEQAVAEQTISELKGRKAYFCSEAEVAQLSQIALDRDKGVMSTEVMGRAPAVIAQMAGFSVPDDTSLLMAPLGGVGDNYPLSSEILAPILAFYVADDFTHAANLCLDLNYHGGIGHTASIFSNDDHVIQEFALLMNAGRIVVNTPSSQGAIGGMCNALHPSLTLGCGTGGGNITTDNITARHLLNIQRIARRRQNERLERFDAALFYDETLDAATLERKYNENY
jgi:acetaldehyde dehydrogenase/alcohol dehydrogenase